MFPEVAIRKVTSIAEHSETYLKWRKQHVLTIRPTRHLHDKLYFIYQHANRNSVAHIRWSDQFSLQTSLWLWPWQQEEAAVRSWNNFRSLDTINWDAISRKLNATSLPILEQSLQVVISKILSKYPVESVNFKAWSIRTTLSDNIMYSLLVFEFKASKCKQN